jgi:competence protein ComEC
MTSPTAPATPYRPFLWLGLALLAGIVISSLVHWVLPVWFGLVGLTLLAAILLQRRCNRFLLSLSLLVFILGGLRYQASQPVLSPNFVAWYNDRSYRVTLTAWLVSPPDPRDGYTNLRLRLITIDTGDRPLSARGLVLARVSPNVDYQYGDVLQLTGYLKTPPENQDFSYRDYLARQGIHSTLQPLTVTPLDLHQGNPFSRAIFSFKDHLLALTHQIFLEPEASLLSGILLGVDTGIAPALQQAFQNTGTSHIIAISGFNIAILAALFASLFGRLLGPRRGAVAAVIAIAFYTLLVGAEASVVRAAIMGGSTIFARQINRRQDGLNTLGLVAGIMCLFNPFLPWDVGFQLTFAATLGLVLYALPMQEFAVGWLSRHMPQPSAQKLATPLAEYFLFTLAAQVTVLPIMAYHFGRISLVALLANPFILPAQPALMVASGLALLLAILYLPLGQLIAWLAWPFSTYTIRLVEFFNTLPHAVLPLAGFSLLFVVVYYTILFTLTLSPSRLKTTLQPLVKPATCLVAFMLIALLTWRVALDLPDERLHLTFLDVGSADAVLIRTPTGRTLLINGGPARSVLTDALGRRLSPFSHRLDVLLVASPLESQVVALPGILESFPPGLVLWSGPADASYSSLRLQSGLVSAAIPITLAQPGQVLDLGAGARLEVLVVTGRGSVLLLEWDAFRALLPIGLDADSLASLEKDTSLSPLSVLLLAASGSAPLNPPGWLTSLQPQLAVLSVSAADLDGLPDPQTLAALQDTPLLRTDRSGWIHISTDGTRMWIETQR